MTKHRNFPRASLVRLICSTLLFAGCVSVAPPPGQIPPARQGDSPPVQPVSGDNDGKRRLPVHEIALNRVELPEQPPQAQAIDLIGAPNDLFERIRRGFAMPELDADLVRYHQQWYLERPDYLRRMVDRSRLYLHHIVEELDRRGMPTELALLPMVESAFNPLAYSRARASGLWQFMPSTGRRYKLDQNWWQDDRRDIVASTAAALEYLQLIYEQHGDWHLALASYNCGEGAVGRAIEKNLAQELPTDYLSLNLPNETRNYVPKLQALKNIFRDPALMAELDLPQVPNQPYFATFTTGAHIDVKLAAKLAEMPEEEFIALNPAHNRPVIKPDTSLVIPAEKLETFVSNLEAHGDENKPLSSWQTYKLLPGDSLEKIAPRFGTTVARLKAVNGIRGKTRPRSGTTLLVPGIGKESDMAALPLYEEPPAKASRGSRAGKKKTRRQNLAAAKTGKTGKRAQAPQASASKTTRYTVRRGDTMQSIARQFKVAVKDLMRRNSVVRPRTLKAGTKLTIPFAEKS
jgi:membrane-bound lytic murein transglycosylase D